MVYMNTNPETAAEAGGSSSQVLVEGGAECGGPLQRLCNLLFS